MIAQLRMPDRVKSSLKHQTTSSQQLHSPGLTILRNVFQFFLIQMFRSKHFACKWNENQSPSPENFNKPAENESKNGSKFINHDFLNLAAAWNTRFNCGLQSQHAIESKGPRVLHIKDTAFHRQAMFLKQGYFFIPKWYLKLKGAITENLFIIVFIPICDLKKLSHNLLKPRWQHICLGFLFIIRHLSSIICCFS